jgi:septum formation protein
MDRIILASASINRQKMMKALGFSFKVVVSQFDEDSVKETNQALRAKKIAIGKAKSVALSHKGIIIAADTFTVTEGKVFEKPKSNKDAKEMLRLLSGNKAICYTGFCFINTKEGSNFSTTVKTEVWFRKLYEKELDEYVKIMPVTEWAAAYAPSEMYVLGMIKKVKGSLTGLTHGLPAEYLVPLLKKAGFTPRVR